MAKFKRKPRLTRPPDPDANWNDPEPDADEALEIAAEILQLIEDAPGDVWESGYKYFTDTAEKVKSIQSNVRRSNKVTDNQLKALKGWRRGVNKWLGKDEDE